MVDQKSCPNVPIAATLDIESLTANDPEPMFITVPISTAFVAQQGGYRYDLEAMRSIVDAIANQKPITPLGDVAFDTTALIWVGATMDADGVAWGKAHVPPSAAAFRESLKAGKAIGKSVGSIGNLPKELQE